MQYQKKIVDIPTKLGVVYSIDTNGVLTNESWGRVVGGRIKGGYHLYCHSGVWKPIHRLVASTFVHNPDPAVYKYVNHKDGNKLNNCADNLEWCTHRQNMEHAVRTGLWLPAEGTSHGRALLSEGDVHLICKSIVEGRTWRQTQEDVPHMTKDQFFSISHGRNWQSISVQYGIKLRERAVTTSRKAYLQAQGNTLPRSAGEDIV